MGDKPAANAVTDRRAAGGTPCTQGFIMAALAAKRTLCLHRRRLNGCLDRLAEQMDEWAD